MARVQKKAQIGFEDKLLENEDLAVMLASRERAKAARDRADVTFKGWDDKAKSLVDTLNLSDGTYRCGAIIITIGKTEAHEVEAFTTKAGRSIRFKDSTPKE